MVWQPFTKVFEFHKRMSDSGVFLYKEIMRCGQSARAEYVFETLVHWFISSMDLKRQLTFTPLETPIRVVC